MENMLVEWFRSIDTAMIGEKIKFLRGWLCLLCILRVILTFYRIAQGDGGRQRGRLTRLVVSSWTRRDQATP